MTTAYVSSTYEDLVECRSAVLLALRRLHVNAVMLEQFAPQDPAALEHGVREAAESDLYIGIFAWRYGVVAPGQDRSNTELEYRAAVAAGKPCLIFLLDEDAPWPRRFFDRDDDAMRIDAFRAELADRHVCSFFSGPSDLGGLVTAAVANTLVDMSRSTGPSAALSPDTRQGYYDRLHQRYSGLDLEVLAPLDDAAVPALRLGSVFVEPRIRREGDTGTAGLFDVLTAAGNRAVVVLGDPGSGKSTLARYVALSLAYDGAPADDRLAALDGHLPLLVELRTYAELRAGGRCNTFVDYFDHLARVDGLGFERATLLAYLASANSALVIFDGLDEVFDPRRRSEITEQIAAFSAEFPRVRAVVTSRIVGYSPQALRSAGFVHVVLQDFDDRQIDAFVTGWYALAMHDDPAGASVRRRRLLQATTTTPSLRELAGNPMLLTVLALIGRRQDLPRSRARLYQHTVQVLVERWDVNRHMVETLSGVLPNIDVADKLEILELVAQSMQNSPFGLANFIPADALHDVVEGYLTEQFGLDRQTATTAARAIISQFRERNFILSRFGPDLYGFVHRVFLEYFAATAIVRRLTQRTFAETDLTELFTRHGNDVSWHEVLRLVVGMLAYRHADDLIELLATGVNRPWPSGAFDKPPRNLVLAVQCLGDIRRGDQKVAQELLRQVILLIEHCVSIDDDDTVALIEQEMLPAAREIGPGWPGAETYLRWYRRRGRHLSWAPVAAPAARLAAILATRSETVEELFEVTGDDTDAALAAVSGLAELAAAVGRTGSFPTDSGLPARTRARLYALARLDERAAVRLAAVEALGTAAGGSAQLRDVLVATAHSDGAAAVRAAAVRVLGARFAADLPARRLLMQVITGDLDPGVRTAAVAALDPSIDRDEIQALLTERITHDPSAEVMAAAATALRPLMAGGHLDRLLLERLAGEPVGRVRLAALTALAGTAVAVP
ncbi:DUF4062 domain-containing protein [Dactylosporangium sp. NPDC049525]|uniref:DUF4062 domain-containing protein n=1 Tax=Dactylosporangium sp. NPDC049525 TaxID=3154730 RepID=UPI00341BBE6C